MALTKANALSEVRRQLGEPTSVVFTDIDINAWLDIGARNVSAVTLCAPLRQAVDLDGSVGVSRIDLTSYRFIKVKAVTFISADSSAEDYALQRITPQLFGHVGGTTTSNPKFWFFFGGYLYLFPPPVTGVVEDIVIYGYQSVSTSGYGTNGDSLPDYLNPLCIDYAVAMAYCKDGKYQKSARAFQRYMSQLMRYRRDITDSIEAVDTLDMHKIPDKTIYPQQLQQQQQ